MLRFDGFYAIFLSYRAFDVPYLPFCIIHAQNLEGTPSSKSRDWTKSTKWRSRSRINSRYTYGVKSTAVLAAGEKHGESLFQKHTALFALGKLHRVGEAFLELSHKGREVAALGININKGRLYYRKGGEGTFSSKVQRGPTMSRV